MMLWAWAGVPLGVYNITEDFNIALRIQPQILTLLSLITWAQCCYYVKKWTLPRCFAVTIAIAALMAGIQTGLVFALRAAKQSHLAWPNILMSVFSAALLAAGVLRHYWDIYLHRSVRGIPFISVGIDAAGDVFSLVSVVFQPRLDVLGIAIYGTELVLWLGVFAAGGYFNLMPWLRRRTRSTGRAGSIEAEEETTPAGAASSSAETDGAGGHISLHNLPSSTSVFRTASCEIPGGSGVRARAAFTASQQD